VDADPNELIRTAIGAREPLDGLRAVVELRHELDEAEARHVRIALHEGRSWTQIADSLGISKQAAHKRHAQRIREGGRMPLTERPQRRLLVTGQARKVVELARDEARQLGNPEVGPEHLLLGLLRDDHGTALRALRSTGVDLGEARRAVAGSTDERPRKVDGRVRVSPAARAALEESLREAVRLGDSHLGVEHLLLALVRDEHSPAGRALTELGVPPAELADRVLGLIGSP
jgi:Clp amino terminal domain, pathogenicity island component